MVKKSRVTHRNICHSDGVRLTHLAISYRVQHTIWYDYGKHGAIVVGLLPFFTFGDYVEYWGMRHRHTVICISEWKIIKKVFFLNVFLSAKWFFFYYFPCWHAFNTLEHKWNAKDSLLFTHKLTMNIYIHTIWYVHI